MEFKDSDAEAWWIKSTTVAPSEDGDVPGLDGYAQAIVDYAKAWAELMEKRIREQTPDGTLPGHSDPEVADYIKEVAEKASHDADTEGITGNMYGWAVYLLAHSWIYGDQLRVWHNTKYDQPDAKGTVNPAVLVLKTKDEA